MFPKRKRPTPYYRALLEVIRAFNEEGFDGCFTQSTIAQRAGVKVTHSLRSALEKMETEGLITRADLLSERGGRVACYWLNVDTVTRLLGGS